MRRTTAWIIAVLALATLATAGAATGQELKTEEQKTLYALGLAISQGLGSFNLSEAELELVKSGLTDGVLNRPRKVDLPTYGPKVQELQTSRQAATAAVEKKLGQSYLDKAAAERRGHQDGVGGDRHDHQTRHRALACDQRQGEGALHRHAARRHRLRQLGAAGPAGDLPPERRDQVLDRGPRHHEGWRQGQARLSRRRPPTATRGRLRRSSRGRHSCSRWSCWRS